MMHFCYDCGRAIDACNIKTSMGINLCPYCFGHVSDLLSSDVIYLLQDLFVHRDYSFVKVMDGKYCTEKPTDSTLPNIVFAPGVKLKSSPKLYTINIVYESSHYTIDDEISYRCLNIVAKGVSFNNSKLSDYLAIRYRYVQSIYDWIYTL